jgi:predicted CopG family antitoxin
METTTIEISVESWQWLSSLKKRPGDSFDDVLSRLREDHEADNLETERTGDSTEDVTMGVGVGQPHDRDDAEQGSQALQEEIEPAAVPTDLDLPGSGSTYEARRQAIGRLVAYLQNERTATRADFLQLIDPDDVGYSSAESFWSNAVKARESLSAVDGVLPPGEGGHTWRYEADQ